MHQNQKQPVRALKSDKPVRLAYTSVGLKHRLTNNNLLLTKLSSESPDRGKTVFVS